MELNDFISDVINLPIQFCLITLAFLYINNISFSLKESIIYSSVVFIPSIILYNYLYWLGIIYIILAMVFYFSWKVKKISGIFRIFSLFTLAIIADHVATLVIIYLSLAMNLWVLILRSIIFALIFIFLVLFYKVFYQKKIIFLKLSFRLQILVTVLITLTLIVLYYNIFTFFGNMDSQIIKINTIISLIYFLISISLIGFIIYLFIKEENLKVRENENKSFIAYINSLEHINREMQKFRHDYMNILLSMKGYIDVRDWDGLINYFEDGILKFEKKTLMESTVLGNLENLQVKGLKGLLLTKSLYAIESDLNMTIEISDSIDNIPVNIIELNRIIGIVLDNAIENCIEDQRKEVQCAILKPSNSILLITVRNQIMDKDIPINKIFNEGYSTKQKGKGLGLSTVKKIVTANPNMNMNVWIEDNWFCFELLIIRGE